MTRMIRMTPTTPMLPTTPTTAEPVAAVPAAGAGGRRRVRLVAALVAATVVVAALAGCGDDGGGARADAADIGVDARPHRASDDAASAQAAIEQLLRDHDRVVNQIVGDPAVVTDPSAALVAEYTALFEPGSEAVQRAIAAWADQAAAGTTTQPASADSPAFASRLDGAVELVGDGEAQFPTCDDQRYAVVGADGSLISLQPGALVPGEGSAVLVAGEWRLRRLDVRPGAACDGEGN
jgi:hypothetical protein